MKNYLKFSIISGLLAALVLQHNLHFVASDDSLFYLQIAFDNLSLGQPSFNGSVITNGFHPLQLILLLILRNIFFFADKETFMYLAFAAGTLMNCLSIYLLSKTCRTLLNNLGLEYFTCVVFTFYIFGGMYFSEASINALMLNWLLWRLTESAGLWPASNSSSPPTPAKDRRSQLISLPILTALCILARLDNIFSIAFLFTYQIYKEKRARLLAPIICGAILLPYLLYNYSFFGALMPVSGQIKSTFPEIRNFISAWNDTTLLSRLTASFLITSLILGIFDKQRNKVLNCFLAGALTNWIYYFLFQEASFHSWYFVQAILLIAICLPASLYNIFKRTYVPALLKSTAMILLLLLPISAFYKGQTSGRGNLNELIMGRTWGTLIYYAVAESAKKVLPEKEKVLVFDLPGYLAYFGNLSVFAIDCLTLNKPTCQELYKDPKVFLKENNINYIIWSLPDACPDNLELKSYYTQTPIGRINLDCPKATRITQQHDIFVVPIIH